MQELVHQNEKIVEAESLPYLQIDTSTLETDLETPALRLTVQNQGVGPARIAEVIMTVNGQPVGNFNTLVIIVALQVSSRQRIGGPSSSAGSATAR